MKIKQIIITLAFPATSFLSKAQDKYEFMVIEYNTGMWHLAVSIDGTFYEKTKVEFDKQEKSGYNANPLLSKVKEYQNQDWEVMNFNCAIIGNTETYFAFLRKKKTDKK